MTDPGGITDLTDLDDDNDDDGLPAPKRSSLLEPGPMGLAGLVLAVVSFLVYSSLDDAFEGRLDRSNTGSLVLALAKRESVAHVVIAVVGGLLCAGALYLADDDDPAWAKIVARAGVLVAAVSVVLHAVAFALAASASMPAAS